jgi:hypothetical protein
MKLVAACVLAPTVHAQQDDSIAAAMNDLQVRVQRDVGYGPHRLQRRVLGLRGACTDRRSGAAVVGHARSLQESGSRTLSGAGC